MFNLIVSGGSDAWEGSQPWSMLADRFGEYSGEEQSEIQIKRPHSLKLLEGTPALVAYEWGGRDSSADVVRYGRVSGVRKSGGYVRFSMAVESHCDRELLDEFAGALNLDAWERHRTHWALKDGDIPKAMLKQMVEGSPRQYRFDVVISYASEDVVYVEQVVDELAKRGLEAFFAPSREAELWGKDLGEELVSIYGEEGRYCVMFLSKAYAEKVWPTHERRAAMARAIQQQGRYVLPCRLDDTKIPGMPPSMHYVDATQKSPSELAKLISDVVSRRRR